MSALRLDDLRNTKILTEGAPKYALALFAAHGISRLVTHDLLYQHCWPQNARDVPSPTYLPDLMRQVRRHLRSEWRLVNEWGRGWRLERARSSDEKMALSAVW